MKKIFKEEESIKILKILGLNDNIEQYQKPCKKKLFHWRNKAKWIDK